MKEQDALNEILQKLDKKEFKKMWKRYLKLKKQMDMRGEPLLARIKSRDMSISDTHYEPLSNEEIKNTLFRCDMEVLRKDLKKLNEYYCQLNDKSIPSKKRGRIVWTIENSFNDKGKAKDKIHKEFKKKYFKEMWEKYIDAKEEILMHDEEILEQKIIINRMKADSQNKYDPTDNVRKMISIYERIIAIYLEVKEDLKCDMEVLREDLIKTHKDFVQTYIFDEFFETIPRVDYPKTLYEYYMSLQ